MISKIDSTQTEREKRKERREEMTCVDIHRLFLFTCDYHYKYSTSQYD